VNSDHVPIDRFHVLHCHISRDLYLHVGGDVPVIGQVDDLDEDLVRILSYIDHNIIEFVLILLLGFLFPLQDDGIPITGNDLHLSVHILHFQDSVLIRIIFPVDFL